MKSSKKARIGSCAAIRRSNFALSVLSVSTTRSARHDMFLEATHVVSPAPSRKSRNAGMRGFTLVELLIAMAIFTLVSLGAYAGLNQVLLAQGRLNEYGADLADIQKTVMMIERDLLQMTDRPVRNEFGDMEPAVRMGDEVLEWTRLGRFGPAGSARSTLWRIGTQ